jgi:Helix-turn-helix domain
MAWRCSIIRRTSGSVSLSQRSGGCGVLFHDIADRCRKTYRTQSGLSLGMSKARLVITAVVVEGRPVAEVSVAYGVARSWIYELLDRYRSEGEAAFEPRSRDRIASRRRSRQAPSN